MHVKFLFVCLVLFGFASVIHCAGQIRLSVIKIDDYIEAGLSNEQGVPSNATGVHRILTSYSNVVQPPNYLPLPTTLFPFDQYKEYFVYQVGTTSVRLNTNYLNITLEDFQSYTFIYVGVSSTDIIPEPTDVPEELLVYEERPNPSPTGKALVKVVNVAVSTHNTEGIVVSFTGEGVNVPSRNLTYREASEFIEFPENVSATLTAMFKDTTLLTVPFVPVAGATVLIYLRGDVSTHSYERYAVDFAFPAAPLASPTAAPLSEPVAAGPSSPVSPPVGAPTATGPVAAGPSAPVSQPTGVSPRPRTPVASSAAKSVAHGSIFGALVLGYLYL